MKQIYLRKFDTKDDLIYSPVLLTEVQQIIPQHSYTSLKQSYYSIILYFTKYYQLR